MSLKTTIKAGIAVGVIGAATLGGAPSWSSVMPSDIAMDSGTAANKADIVYAATVTIAASGNTVLNLGDGSLLDAIGEALTFVKVKAISIVAAVGNTNKVQMGGNGTTPFIGPFADATDKIEVPAGGRAVLSASVAGWTVGSGVLLKLANSSGTTSVTFDIVIVGTSA